jgi:hypothetical protein
MVPIKISTYRVQAAISPGIMRLESGADDSLPFHVDVKKLVECELHSPIHSVYKENFC